MATEYQIVIANRRVEKQLDRLPGDVFARVQQTIQQLRNTPRPPGCRKLRHSAIGEYRLRAGDWRIIYDVNDDTCEIVIVRVMHRREVYRRR